MHETLFYKILMFIKAYFVTLKNVIISLLLIGIIGLVLVGVPYYFIINGIKMPDVIVLFLIGCILPAINRFNKREP